MPFSCRAPYAAFKRSANTTRKRCPFKVLTKKHINDRIHHYPCCCPLPPAAAVRLPAVRKRYPDTPARLSCQSTFWPPSGHRGRDRNRGISEHPATRLKPVTELLDDESLLPETLLELCVWAAGYYQYPTGDALSTALPATLRKGDAIPRQSGSPLAIDTVRQGTARHGPGACPRQQQALNILQQQPSATKDDFQRQGISIAALRQAGKPRA